MPENSERDYVKLLGFFDDPVGAAAKSISVQGNASEKPIYHVVIIIRFPEGQSEIKRRLESATPQEVSIEVVALREHARRVHEQIEDTPTLLKGISGHPILRAAVTNRYRGTRAREAISNGLQRDLWRSVVEALSQGSEIPETNNETLEDVRSALISVRESTQTHEVLLPEQLIVWAANTLHERTALRNRMQVSTDIFVALDAEEYTDAEWNLVTGTASHTPLVRIERANTATSKLFNASGCYTTPTTAPPETVPQVIAATLATGQMYPADSLKGDARMVVRSTDEGELTAIESEIRQAFKTGIPPDEIAIVCRDANCPIGDIVSWLSNAGIPTATQHIDTEESPLTTELRRLVDTLAPDRTPEISLSKHFEDLVDEEVRRTIATCVGDIRTARTTSTGLKEWVQQSRMHDRLVDRHAPGMLRLNADTTTARVDAMVLDKAREVTEGVDYLGKSTPGAWNLVADSFEDLRDTAQVPVKRPVDRHGVIVTSARAMKLRSRHTVIIPFMTATEQQRLPTIPRVFSRSEIGELFDYPAHFAVKQKEYQQDFPDPDPVASDYHRAYFSALARRQYALAARAATDELIMTCSTADSEPAPLLGKLQAGYPIKSNTYVEPGSVGERPKEIN